MKETLVRFAEENKIHLLEREPLSRHTTFQTGGPARWFALPETEEQLCLLLDFAEKQALHTAVIGKGSNLLAPDEGFDGLIIKTPEEEPVWLDECTVQVSCGYALTRLSALVANRGLAGLSFAQGIPGTVGGAVVMNAGAYGGQIADTLLSSTCRTPEGIRELQREEHEYAYRHSVYEAHPSWTVLHAVFRLTPGDKATIQAEMADYAARRREKQPLEYPSAGSTFKRPEGYFAGKLIEECGLKGYQIGGAQVSEKHAGFVINRGGASSADILSLMEHIRCTVEKKTDILLEPEVRILK